MSDKRKKRKFQEKREKRRQKMCADDGRWIDGVKVPPEAVLADLSAQVPNNSYSPPPRYYVDREFTCVDCGREEVGTAEQQKWYYEVAKGSLYAIAIRCRDCRLAHAEKHSGRGDPYPIKHMGTVMKRIRQGIEPSLRTAGFQVDGQSQRIARETWPLYLRPGFILLCSCAHGRLVAEIMDDSSSCQTIAELELHGSVNLSERIEDFVRLVCQFLQNLPIVDTGVDADS